jgi:transglutaminase-like putative cysteine protease
MDESERYLRPTAIIDSDSTSIKEKARQLVGDSNETAGKAKDLFYFVRDEIKYNMWVFNDQPEYYRASRTLELGQGFCMFKAILLVALARSVAIPSRIRLVAVRNHLVADKVRNLLGGNLFPTHGYDELYIDGNWVKANPAFDSKMCQKNRLIPVEFDGRNDALFHRHNLDGKLHIEYIHDYGYYDDLPFEKIVQLRNQFIGADWPDRWRRVIEARKGS